MNDTRPNRDPARENEVVMIRHAQSLWNRQNRFTGWADPPLTESGIAEARNAGQRLRRAGFRFDRAYSSRLERAWHTLDLVLEAAEQADLTRDRDWRLNERHYGALQGRDKAKMAQHVGEAQVNRWRRGYADLPPALAAADPRHQHGVIQVTMLAQQIRVLGSGKHLALAGAQPRQGGVTLNALSLPHEPRFAELPQEDLQRPGVPLFIEQLVHRSPPAGLAVGHPWCGGMLGDAVGCLTDGQFVVGFGSEGHVKCS